MKRPNRRTYVLVTAAALVLALLATALPILGREAAAPTLLWGNVSSGYSNSNGEGFRLAATAGQVDAGLPQAGDGFRVTGGLWGFVAEPPPAPEAPPPGYGLFLPLTVRP